MVDMDTSYDEFREDLLREAETFGEPQQACFFQMYSQVAAENGDCIDLTYTPVKKEGSTGYQIDGYALDTDRGELYLAVCDFRPDSELQTINQGQIDSLCSRIERFVKKAIHPEFINSLEETSPAFEAAYPIYNRFNLVKRVRLIIFSNARLVARKKGVDSREVAGKVFTYNLLDFSRYLDIIGSRSGSEPIEIDLMELNKGPLPCLKAHTGSGEYESFLIVMPGSLLAQIYGLYGPRLLEQNVRTFLQAKTKVNKGIITTLEKTPEMFFAYNNGLTATASGVTVGPIQGEGVGITSVKNFQIVNGGQTTASILYSKDNKNANLDNVFVQMKLSVVDETQVEIIVPKISRYANTQNKISEADFFSSHPFHLEMEKISRRLSTPQKEGSFVSSKWFYERARGQYKDKLAYGTAATKKKFEAEYPKKQHIVKTDLAKYLMTFDCEPQLVSKGAQKCFLGFAEKIDTIWKSRPDHFNEIYFKDSMAKAMVFRWTDQMVAKSEWYKEDRGHKANIVTYTLAWLVNYVEKTKGLSIDLNQIWARQDLSNELKEVIEQLAPRIAGIVKDAPANIKNIGEYCKQQVCWSAVRSTSFGVTSKIDASLIDKATQKENVKEAIATKKIDNEIEFESILFNLIPKIDDLFMFSKSRKLLSPKSNSALNKLSVSNIDLSKSEINSLKHLFSRLKDEGYDLDVLP